MARAHGLADTGAITGHARGLADEEAARRLVRHGQNAIAASERELPLVILPRQVSSPMIDVLLATDGVTAVLGKYLGCRVVLAIVAVNSIVGFAQDY